MTNNTKLWPVAAFTLAYLLAALLTALIADSAEFIVYIVVMLVLMGAVWVVHQRVTLTMSALWGLSVWGLLHMAGGLLVVPATWPTNEASRVLYTLWIIPDFLKYDHIVHAYGFGITTWVCWQGIRAALQTESRSVRPTFGLLVLSAAAGLGFGALNEVIEFVATLLVPDTGVGGYVNTGWDLVANTVGATTAAISIAVYSSRKASTGSTRIARRAGT